jgi:PDZ domain-containing protein
VGAVRRALAAAVALLVVLGVLAIPLPYVALSPGAVFDTLGPGPTGRPLIQVTGHRTYRSAGRLELTAVAMRGGPGPSMTLLNYLRAKLSSDTDVYPERMFVADGTSGESSQTNALRDMETTQARAVRLALAELAIAPSAVRVRIDAADVGGTSAGLMLTLGLIDLLTPGDLTGGRRIAGTGAVDDRGAVVGIAGIRQKMISAKRAGDTVFLTPAANCAAAAAVVPDGLQLLRVSSVDDALTALAALRAGRHVPGC